MNEWKEVIIIHTTTERKQHKAMEITHKNTMALAMRVGDERITGMDGCVANMIMIYTHFHYKHIK